MWIIRPVRVSATKSAGSVQRVGACLSLRCHERRAAKIRFIHFSEPPFEAKYRTKNPRDQFGVYLACCCHLVVAVGCGLLALQLCPTSTRLSRS